MAAVGTPSPEDSVDYPVTLGGSFLGTKEPTFCSLVYDFKPASTDNQRPGKLQLDPQTNKTALTLPVGASGPDQLIFKGQYEPSKDDMDCVAIFDGHGWRLEVLPGVVNHLRAPRQETQPQDHSGVQHGAHDFPNGVEAMNTAEEGSGSQRDAQERAGLHARDSAEVGLAGPRQEAEGRSNALDDSRNKAADEQRDTDVHLVHADWGPRHGEVSTEGNKADIDICGGDSGPADQVEHDRGRSGFSPDKVSSAGSNGVVGRAENEAQGQPQTHNLDSIDEENKAPRLPESEDDLVAALADAMADDGEDVVDKSMDDLTEEPRIELTRAEDGETVRHNVNSQGNASPMSSARSSHPKLNAEDGKDRRGKLSVPGNTSGHEVGHHNRDVPAGVHGTLMAKPLARGADAPAPQHMRRQHSVQNEIEAEFFADDMGDDMAEEYVADPQPFGTEGSGVEPRDQPGSDCSSTSASSGDDSSSCSDGSPDEHMDGSGGDVDDLEVEHF